MSVKLESGGNEKKFRLELDENISSEYEEFSQVYSNTEGLPLLSIVNVSVENTTNKISNVKSGNFILLVKIKLLTKTYILNDFNYCINKSIIPPSFIKGTKNYPFL